MNSSCWDRVPSSIIVCEGVGGRITTVNKLFRQRVFNFPTIAHVHFIELVRDSEADAVKSVLARAMLDGQLHTVSFGLLVLDCTNSFPKHVPCTAQITADGDDLVISVVLHKCGLMTCQIDDTARDFLANAPTPLHRIGKLQLEQAAHSIHRATGQVMWANKFELNMMEYTESEYIGMPIANFLVMPPEVLAAAWQTLNDHDVAYDFYQYWRTKSGKLIAVTNTSNLRKDSSGNMINTRCFVQHDTARQVQAA
eukprot:10479-Heterococcus_DN1.PRE.1